MISQLQVKNQAACHLKNLHDLSRHIYLCFSANVYQNCFWIDPRQQEWYEMQRLQYTKSWCIWNCWLTTLSIASFVCFKQKSTSWDLNMIYGIQHCSARQHPKVIGFWMFGHRYPCSQHITPLLTLLLMFSISHTDFLKICTYALVYQARLIANHAIIWTVVCNFHIGFRNVDTHYRHTSC